MHVIYSNARERLAPECREMEFALDAESMPGSMIKPALPADFVDFMTRVAFEQVLPHKSVADASDSRKTRREYRKNAIISFHCLKLPHCR